MSNLTTDEDGSDFAALIGGFGTHANVKRRAKAERMAAMRKDDGRSRRKKSRPHQFNVRVDDETKAITQALMDKFSGEGRDDNKKWSQADVVIAALAALAKAEKVRA